MSDFGDWVRALDLIYEPARGGATPSCIAPTARGKSAADAADEVGEA
ncbi:hypothetical protein [Halorussus pelagicus]|nr:hypothetical protein [Halorussus pelagicus]